MLNTMALSVAGVEQAMGQRGQMPPPPDFDGTGQNYILPSHF